MTGRKQSAWVLLATVAYLIPLTQVWSGAGDAGTVIYGAQRVSEGGVPGRDFFEVMGPGSFYWLGVFFAVLGKSWEVTRLQLLVTGAGTVMLLYAIARQVCDGRTAIFAWLFVLVMGMPLWPETSHHWDSNFFAVAAVWCYLRFEKTGRKGWLPAAGGLCAVTCLCLQQKGFYLLVALVACAAWRRRADTGSAGRLLVGFAAVAAVVAVYFWRAGALPGLFYSNVVFPFAHYGGINKLPYGFGWQATAMQPSFRVFDRAWAPVGFLCAGLSFLPVMAVIGLPVLAATATLRFRRAGPLPVVMLAGVAFWISELHRPDIFHLAYGAPLMAIAVVGSAATWRRKVLRDGAAMAVAAGLVVFGGLTLTAKITGTHRIETRRGSILSTGEEPALRFLCSSVKARDWVFVYPYNPIYYYLADVRNPTRFSILLYGYNTPAQFQEVIRDLEEMRTPWVVWNRGVYGQKLQTWFPAYLHPETSGLLLEHYLERNYAEVGGASGLRIMRRKKGLPPAIPD